MSQRSLLGARRMQLAVPLHGRDPDEEHRAATPLELFFDLVFVVAVAQAAAHLHHGLEEGFGGAFLNYLLVFFAVWWGWMNVTWFASA
jgi:low temperature requirement protein LtrA